MLIDTHSHIYSEDFIHDRDEALKRADESGIKKIILPNIDSGSIKHMLDLAGAYPNLCFPLIGLHPTSVEEDYEEELEAIEYWLQRRKFYGIGEIGIDLYWEQKYLKEQINAFRYQLRLAKEYKLPVVLHVRESFDEVVAVLEEENQADLTGVFHSFTGTVEQANKIVALGFKIGIGGIVTFKNSDMELINIKS